MGKWLIGYLVFLTGLFAVCLATAGIETTLWGFGITHLGCALATLALWWQDERRWSGTAWSENVQTIASIPLTPAVASEPPLARQEDSLSTDWLGLQEANLDLLQSYTETLTKKVSAVYPVVAQDHIRKIIWTVMIELCGKQLAESADGSQTTASPAKRSQVA